MSNLQNTKWRLDLQFISLCMCFSLLRWGIHTKRWNRRKRWNKKVK